MNYKIGFITLAIVLGVLLLIGGTIVYSSTIAQKNYELGLKQGQLYTIQTITQTGNIPVLVNETIQVYSIQQLCGTTSQEVT